MKPKATEVFVPGSYPVHTYIERAAEQLEQALSDALATPGQVVSLCGPSKSGKTVLVEKVVGREHLISVSGTGLQSPEDIWDRALDWMDVPETVSRARSTGGSIGTEAEGTVSGGLPFVGRVEGTIAGSSELTHERTRQEVRARRGLQQVADEIANSDYVLLVDDFHYMPRAVQIETAKAIKEAVRLGVRTCTAAVRHRGDDVVRANPELRGRVRSIDLDYWSATDLGCIASDGFAALNATVNQCAIQQFVDEAAGSPQLMQLICLQACFVLGLRERSLLPVDTTVDEAQLAAIFEQTSASTDFRSLVDVLDAGPKTRGSERKTYRFDDDSEGDVYRCVLKAVASDPPRLTFSYEELTVRAARICHGDAPVGSSITSTCVHMSKLATEKFPSERVIDWDEQKQVLDIPDPYFLFYLRWSGRLRENE